MALCQIIMATSNGWAKVKEASAYAGVKPRTFRKWFSEGLRSVRTPTGTILVKLEWIDIFLERFEINNNHDGITDIVNSALDGLI